MQYINQIKTKVKLDYKNKAVFFDRDGVINKMVDREGGFYSPRKIKDFEFYTDIKDCINFFSKNNYLIIIISNQPDISRKKMSLSELKKIDLFMNDYLKIDAIYYSFDDTVFERGSKKPSPKMIFDAQKEWNINLEKSFFIGDSQVDIECAKNASVKFILVEREHNKDIIYSQSVDNLHQVKDLILL